MSPHSARVASGTTSQALIRLSRLTDLEQLLKIERQSFREHRFTARQFTYYIRRRSSVLAVVEVDGEVVGYVAGSFLRVNAKRLARLYSVAVISRWRKLGLGSRLLTFFENAAARMKCDSIVLEVRQTNRAARRLYEEFGYGHDRTLVDYYGPGKTGLRLRKRLNF